MGTNLGYPAWLTNTFVLVSKEWSQVYTKKILIPLHIHVFSIWMMAIIAKHLQTPMTKLSRPWAISKLCKIQVWNSALLYTSRYLHVQIRFLHMHFPFPSTITQISTPKFSTCNRCMCISPISLQTEPFSLAIPLLLGWEVDNYSSMLQIGKLRHWPHRFSGRGRINI